MDVMETTEYQGTGKYSNYGLRVEYIFDQDADLSFMGEYSDSWSEGAIDRKEKGDADRGELQYWIPGPNHYPHNPKNWDHVKKAVKAKVIKEFGSLGEADHAYMMRDYERMEAFNRGDWHMMGIAVTVIKGEFDIKDIVVTGTLQIQGAEVGSASLWGIESDSDTSYVESVEDELIDEAAAEAGLPKSVVWEEV